MNTEHTKCPAMEPRLPLDDDKPDGYMESDQSFIGHNCEWLAWCEANARLIAAAPELLAFAEMVEIQANGDLTLGQFADYVTQEARKVIARATGH